MEAAGLHLPSFGFVVRVCFVIRHSDSSFTMRLLLLRSETYSVLR